MNMDFVVQDAGMLYPDFPTFPNELICHLASLFRDLVIIWIFVGYFARWLWELPLHLA